jgi:outer membrane biosynthesis protein TonB
MDAVKRASPFLPFPGNFGKSELQFEINIIFKIITDK